VLQVRLQHMSVRSQRYTKGRHADNKTAENILGQFVNTLMLIANKYCQFLNT